MAEYFDDTILVHSDKPIRILSDDTLKEFEKNFHLGMNVEEKIALSHVLGGDSLLICTTNGEDPTLSYLPVICQAIDKEISEPKESSVGPIAIVIVPTQLHALHVWRLSAALLNPECLEKNGLVTAVRNIDNIKVYNQLKKGCGILVATFAHFELLLAQNVKVNLIDKSRLKHVIIVDLDVMSIHNYSRFFIIMSNLTKLCMTESNGQQIIVPQVIATTQFYNRKLMQFLIQRIRHPLIIFKDFIEATVYGGIDFAIRTSSHNLVSKKDLLLLEVKKYKNLKQRTIIFCKSFNDVGDVQEDLIQNGIGFLIGKNDNIEQIKDWKSNLVQHVLICTDDFESLTIHEADNVIHYTYPDDWYSFKKRHSVLVGNYQNMMNADFHSVNGVKQSVVVLISEYDTFDLNLLIELFIKQKRKINPEIIQLANTQLKRSKLKCARQSFCICPDLAIYDLCKTVRCAYNHIIGPKDILNKKQQEYVPTSGIVSIQILQVYSPTHFAVRLLKWKASMQDEFHDLPLTFNTMSCKLKLIYDEMEYPEKYWPPKVGEICVVKMGSQYQRIRILIIPKNIADNLIITGQVLDEDMKVVEIKCSELLVCPPEIQVVPPMVMHLYLWTILPKASLAVEAGEQVKSWLNLEDQTNGKTRYEAEILGSLIHTMFATNVLAYTKKSFFSREQCLDLSKKLIKERYGEYDPHNAIKFETTKIIKLLSLNFTYKNYKFPPNK